MKHLDTSVAIDHLRRKPEATLLLDSIFEQGEDVAASELVRFEVLAGAREGELDETERFLSLLDWLHVDQDVARVGAALASMYRSAHSCRSGARVLRRYHSPRRRRLPRTTLNGSLATGSPNA
jgi:predicted nucleic acid-binding protein